MWWSLSKHQIPRGIILISLDTLRADHLGIYGYHRNTSPSIDAFSNESVVFDRAVVQSPFTLPSHMSIMTSLHPSSHGVLTKDNRLADELVTLAELLREGGYKTAAFTDGAFMKGDYGFKQGFDIYDGDKRIGIARILPKVKKWLEENKSKPFLLFIHCYDIHDPYTPPAPYNTIFHDFTYAGNFVPSTENMQAAAWRGMGVSDEDLHHIKALYDGGIRYTDDKIGEFLSYLQEAGLQDNSLIIITSDHGEEFREHGSFLHWKLYFRPNLHVPLIMHMPNYPKKKITIRELVQSIDILPTILDVAHLPPHSNAQGRTLLPMIKRNSTFLGRFWVHLLHSFSKDENTSIAIDSIKNIPHHFSIISDCYQLIYNIKSGSIQLFDLRNDPLAQNNITNNHKTTVKQLLSKLNQINNALPRYKTSTFILDAETREQLETLGYINDIEPTMVDTHDPLQIEHHWLEAEDGDTVVSPLEIATDKNASNDRFIYAPNGTGNEYTPGSTIMATYRVHISQAGEYILWGRVQALDGRDNSFFVQINDNLDNLWEVETGDYWYWDKVTDRDNLDPVRFILKSGVHTIKIKLREDGTKLDKLLLTNNVDFVPSGKEGIIEN